eukprot:TRINITY_DN1713_c0_g1_i7.p1 TRINITY_DN1713_c0_g1~~TRINITY_DN1713_c0_g1_i7.p1  ORF type:complete len:602 (+),score=70.64 TRINITY_DN1713_c0_g1_i7:104-1909(+)
MMQHALAAAAAPPSVVQRGLSSPTFLPQTPSGGKLKGPFLPLSADLHCPSPTASTVASTRHSFGGNASTCLTSPRRSLGGSPSVRSLAGTPSGSIYAEASTPTSPTRRPFVPALPSYQTPKKAAEPQRRSAGAVTPGGASPVQSRGFSGVPKNAIARSTRSSQSVPVAVVTRVAAPAPTPSTGRSRTATTFNPPARASSDRPGAAVTGRSPVRRALVPSSTRSARSAPVVRAPAKPRTPAGSAAASIEVPVSPIARPAGGRPAAPAAAGKAAQGQPQPKSGETSEPRSPTRRVIAPHPSSSRGKLAASTSVKSPSFSDAPDSLSPTLGTMAPISARSSRSLLRSLQPSSPSTRFGFDSCAVIASTPGSLTLSYVRSQPTLLSARSTSTLALHSAPRATSPAVASQPTLLSARSASTSALHPAPRATSPAVASQPTLMSARSASTSALHPAPRATSPAVACQPVASSAKSHLPRSCRRARHRRPRCIQRQEPPPQRVASAAAHTGCLSARPVQMIIRMQSTPTLPLPKRPASLTVPSRMISPRISRSPSPSSPAPLMRLRFASPPAPERCEVEKKLPCKVILSRDVSREELVSSGRLVKRDT